MHVNIEPNNQLFFNWDLKNCPLPTLNTHILVIFILEALD